MNLLLVFLSLVNHHLVRCQRLDIYDKLFRHAKVRDVPVAEKWRIVRDEYIVVFDYSDHDKYTIDANASLMQDFIHSSGATIQYMYQTTFKGVAIRSMPVNRMLLLLDKFINIVKYVTPVRFSFVKTTNFQVAEGGN